MNVDEGYFIAERIRKRTYGCNSPESICESLGIELVICDLHYLKGMYSSRDRFRTIYLNSRLRSYYEMLQTLYHEIGHDQIPEHREFAKNAYLADVSIMNTQDQTERQANVVAAHVLIDDDSVIEYLQDGNTLDCASRHFRIHEDLLILKLEEMKKKMGQDFPFDLARLPRSADPCFLKASNGMVEEFC